MEQKIRSGRSTFSDSYPNPSVSITPGLKLSTMTSAFLQSSLIVTRSLSSPVSSVTLFLPLFHRNDEGKAL